MDKSEILKARVSKSLYGDFLEVCTAMGKAPATQMRALIQDFVAERQNLADDKVKIFIEQPDDYDFGAWRVRISLSDPKLMQRGSAPIPFALPRLDKRLVRPDDGYAVAASNWDGTGSGLDGIFVEGVWEGHVYSNGIAEADNPTPISEMAEALKCDVQKVIDALSGKAP